MAGLREFKQFCIVNNIAVARSYTTAADCEEGIIHINDDDVEELSAKFGDLAEVYAYCHEAGHILNYRNNLDKTDEVLAWETGKDIYLSIYGNKPGIAWYTMRAHMLSTYGLR